MIPINKSALSIHLATYLAYFLFTIGFVGISSFKAQCQSTTTPSLPKAQLVSFKEDAKKEVWTVDKVHSTVGFSITHLVISEVEGRFKVYDGTIKSNAGNFDGANISFLVDVASINTENEMRDNHLKSEDFFNAEQYPQMKFESVSFTKTSGEQYLLKGKLTIRDITKEVTFDVKLGGILNDDGYGNTKAGFKASTTINRFDYGLKWSSLTEAGGLTVGDEVVIDLNLQFAKNK